MVSENISLVNLLRLLDSRLPANEWGAYDPATIMLELGSIDPLLVEKIYVLQTLLAGVNAALNRPEFVIWMTSIANNEPAEFEMISMPSSLHLGWMIEQAKGVAALLGQPWEPREGLKATVEYLLNEEGYSEPVYPFDFIPNNVSGLLQPGQSEEETVMKATAVKLYIAHMNKVSND